MNTFLVRTSKTVVLTVSAESAGPGARNIGKRLFSESLMTCNASSNVLGGGNSSDRFFRAFELRRGRASSTCQKYKYSLGKKYVKTKRYLSESSCGNCFKPTNLNLIFSRLRPYRLLTHINYFWSKHICLLHGTYKVPT